MILTCLCRGVERFPFFLVFEGAFGIGASAAVAWSPSAKGFVVEEVIDKLRTYLTSVLSAGRHRWGLLICAIDLEILLCRMRSQRQKLSE